MDNQRKCERFMWKDGKKSMSSLDVEIAQSALSVSISFLINIMQI